jgi:hypothetical protein
MNIALKAIYLFILSVGLCFQVFGTPIQTVDVDSHLENYAEFNVTHHDNIDDTTHAHTHRHSEHEEEHEHSHHHSSTNFVEYKLINLSSTINLKFTFSFSKDNFHYRELVSSTHFLELFRPPIS